MSASAPADDRNESSSNDEAKLQVYAIQLLEHPVHGRGYELMGGGPSGGYFISEHNGTFTWRQSWGTPKAYKRTTAVYYDSLDKSGNSDGGFGNHVYEEQKQPHFEAYDFDELHASRSNADDEDDDNDDPMPNLTSYPGGSTSARVKLAIETNVHGEDAFNIQPPGCSFSRDRDTPEDWQKWAPYHRVNARAYAITQLDDWERPEDEIWVVNRKWRSDNGISDEEEEVSALPPTDYNVSEINPMVIHGARGFLFALCEPTPSLTDSTEFICPEQYFLTPTSLLFRDNDSEGFQANWKPSVKRIFYLPDNGENPADLCFIPGINKNLFEFKLTSVPHPALKEYTFSAVLQDYNKDNNLEPTAEEEWEDYEDIL